MKIETHWVYLWGYWIAADNAEFPFPSTIAAGTTEDEAVNILLQLKTEQQPRRSNETGEHGVAQVQDMAVAQGTERTKRPTQVRACSHERCEATANEDAGNLQ